MKEATLLALIATVRWLVGEIPKLAEKLRAKGELTAEGEAAYQAHQDFVYSKPEAQPSEDGAGS